MADVTTLQVLFNGFRNATIRATCVSDGTAAAVKIYDATASGAFGINVAGQVFYPGIYTRVTKLWYDVQDTKIRIQWEATQDTDILPLGSAPEDFDFTSFGGIVVPTGLTGATGSIKVLTVDPVVDATYSVILQIRKGIPQS